MIFSANDLTGAIGKAEVNINSILGRGATAVVYLANFQGESFAAKIYHADQRFDKAKIEAMLANIPTNVRIQVAGGLHAQLAWPIAWLSDSSGKPSGYLMPLLDLKRSFSLDHFYDQSLIKKLKSPSESALSFKLEIARNLTLLVTDLHDHGHYFIDMKPQNIRVLLGSHVVTLVDCDGFSIAGSGGQRYPAELLSSDYISPEAYRNNTLPANLGESQDRYSLAVILFQLLNRGTHPFQGIITSRSISAATNDEKAAQGLYPHGLVPNPRVAPRPQSIHFLLDDKLRALFDAAFTENEMNRPSARDWADCLDKLLRNKGLERCEKEPYDVTHMRFIGKECPSCYLSKLQPLSIQSSQIEIPNLPPKEWTVSVPIAAEDDKKMSGATLTFLVLFFAGIFILMIVGSQSSTSSTSNTTYTPATVSNACNLSFDSSSTENLCSWYWSNTYAACNDRIIRVLSSRQVNANQAPCAKHLEVASTITSPPVDPMLALHEFGNLLEVTRQDAPEIWPDATKLIIEKVNSNLNNRVDRNSSGTIFIPNVPIHPFKGIRINYGTSTCKDAVEAAGLCLAEDAGIVCDSEMFEHANADKKLCLSALIK